MSLERRLQHAARDLRAVDVTVPPLGERGRNTGRRRFGLQVVAVPLLFVVGGLVVVGVLEERRDAGGSFDDTPAVVAEQSVVAGATGGSVGAGAVGAGAVETRTVAPSSLARPSADAERVVIDRLVTAAARPVATPVSPVASPPTGPAIGFNGPL